jgi:predicted RNase H-like HicB family nuclease
MSRFLVVIEKAGSNWGAYAPDLPGCGVTGDTIEETITLMKEALELHLTAMIEDGDPLPEPTSLTEYIEIDGDSLSLEKKSA